MAFLFLVFLIAMVFLYYNFRKTALILAVINLFFCLAMLWHHADSVLNILL